MHFCFVQLCSLISRNFHYDAMQQYRKSNFSDMFCLNCIFVMDATVKHFIKRSFLECGASAVTMAALKHFFNKIESNLCYTRFITLAVVPKRGSEWRGPTPLLITPVQHSSEETLQQWQAVGYSASDSTGLGIEPQIFRVDSDIFNTTLLTAGLLKSY